MLCYITCFAAALLTLWDSCSLGTRFPQLFNSVLDVLRMS